MSSSNPLLDTFGVEDMFLVAVKRGNKIIAHEVAPANWTLPHDTVLTLIKSLALPFLFHGGLFCLKLGLIKRLNDFRYRQGNS